MGSNFVHSHRNETSPLTQGLNHRSASDRILKILQYQLLRLQNDRDSFDWWVSDTLLPISDLN